MVQLFPNSGGFRFLCKLFFNDPLRIKPFLKDIPVCQDRLFFSVSSLALDFVRIHCTALIPDRKIGFHELREIPPDGFYVRLHSVFGFQKRRNFCCKMG